MVGFVPLHTLRLLGFLTTMPPSYVVLGDEDGDIFIKGLFFSLGQFYFNHYNLIGLGKKIEIIRHFAPEKK
jgi:hypothetical protein